MILDHTEYVDESFDGLQQAETQLQGSRFRSCSFRHANLEALVTAGCLFDSCDLTEVRFNASKHVNSAFVNCRFRGTHLFAAKFEDCKLTGSVFEAVRWSGFSNSGGDWSYTNLRHSNLKGVSLRGARLLEADLYESNLEGADLRDTDLGNAVLSKANLAKADLRGANVGGIDFSTVSLRGVRLDVAQAVVIVQSLGATIE